MVKWTLIRMWINIARPFQKGWELKTVQMTLEEDLVEAVDRAARQLHTTRSGFARLAFKAAMKEMQARELEKRHREGYQRKPAQKSEFGDWEREHAWGDE